MKDKMVIITIVAMVVLFIGVITTVILVQSGNYGKKSATLTSDIAKAQKKVDEIEAAKDTNNFTPVEAVTAFLAEVKADDSVKSKLYLDASVQSMDIKNTLKLGNDLSNLVVGDSEYTATDEDATVTANLQVGEDLVARSFALKKVEGAWKITGVTAE